MFIVSRDQRNGIKFIINESFPSFNLSNSQPAFSQFIVSGMCRQFRTEIIQCACLTCVFICSFRNAPNVWLRQKSPAFLFIFISTHFIFPSIFPRLTSENSSRSDSAARKSRKSNRRSSDTEFDVFSMSRTVFESCAESHLIANFENTLGLSSRRTAFLESLHWSGETSAYTAAGLFKLRLIPTTVSKSHNNLKLPGQTSSLRSVNLRAGPREIRNNYYFATSVCCVCALRCFTIRHLHK